MVKQNDPRTSSRQYAVQPLIATMHHTEKQLIIGVALLLFTGLMIALLWSLWGDPQLEATSQPRRAQAAGNGRPHTKVVVTAVKEQLTVAEFDLCDVIEYYGSANVFGEATMCICVIPGIYRSIGLAILITGFRPGIGLFGAWDQVVGQRPPG